MRTHASAMVVALVPSLAVARGLGEAARQEQERRRAAHAGPGTAARHAPESLDEEARDAAIRPGWIRVD
jgi:hypothetical protein